MKKLLIFSVMTSLLILSSFLVGANIDFAYSHNDGSKVFFNEEGKISYIFDNFKGVCRLPNKCEMEENDYLLMSCKE